MRKDIMKTKQRKYKALTIFNILVSITTVGLLIYSQMYLISAIPLILLFFTIILFRIFRMSDLQRCRRLYSEIETYPIGTFKDRE